MTTLYLARHGSTAWNENPRFRGLADIPLSDTGVRQARALASMLEKRPLSAVYASPLRRAVQTAQILADSHGLAVQPVAGLQSVNYGHWEGLTEQEAKQKDPELYARFLNAIETVRYPGGESMDELRARAVASFEQIAQAHPDQEVAVVTHQVVTRVLLCAILGVSSAPYWKLGQDPACLNVIEYRRGFRLKMMNLVPGSEWVAR